MGRRLPRRSELYLVPVQHLHIAAWLIRFEYCLHWHGFGSAARLRTLTRAACLAHSHLQCRAVAMTTSATLALLCLERRCPISRVFAVLYCRLALREASLESITRTHSRIEEDWYVDNGLLPPTGKFVVPSMSFCLVRHCGENFASAFPMELKKFGRLSAYPPRSCVS